VPLVRDPQRVPIGGVAVLAGRRAPDQLDPRTARDLTRALRARGLQARPRLASLVAELGEERWGPKYDAPGRVIAGTALQTTLVEVRRSVVPALVGALAVTILAALVGWYRWAPYGAVAITAGGVAAIAVCRGFDVLDERVPRIVPRSAALGACIAAAAILSALAIFVAVRALA
jgi:hypothetical protein